MDEPDAWGQLVSLSDFESAPIILVNNKFSIGRATDCDLSLSDNKLVSGRHCCIHRDDAGKVTLQDNSTNGTLLNMTYKISKGKSKEIEHGDEFYIVYKKDNAASNVGYIYQDTAKLQEEEGTQEYSAPEDMLDATFEDSDCNYISPARKRKSEDNETSSDENPAKKTKTEATDKAKATINKDKESPETKAGPSDIANPLLSEKKEVTKATADITKADKEKDEVDAECKRKSEDSGKTVEKSKVVVPDRDDIEENLQCMICQEIMHNCISLQPCLHSFCAGCYSDWMKRSQECPTCRKKVKRINKNHIVNNLIEAYLKEHPDKKRPEEDIKELDAKNKVTKDMLYPKGEMVDEGSSSDYTDSNADESDEGGDTTTNVPAPAPFQGIFGAPPPPTLFGFGTPFFGTVRAQTICRQCPGYKAPDTGIIATAITTVKNIITGAGGETSTAADDKKQEVEPSTSGEATPGTSGGEPAVGGSGDGEPSASKTGPISKPDIKEMPVAPPYVCRANQNHVMCQCCLMPMPDHRVNILHATPGIDRPQQCVMCYRAFCHAYWGCRKQACNGCLAPFKDMNFTRTAFNGLILDNAVESTIFRDYIDSKKMTVKDLLYECCQKMDAGEFTSTAQGTHALTSKTPVCYTCGLNSFKQLALQYRKTIAKDQLPDGAKNRPDCYWGSQCRTQRNKPHHAQNFNHICDKTRQF